MAARAGVEPTTLWLKAIDSTKAPPCPILSIHSYSYPVFLHNYTFRTCHHSGIHPRVQTDCRVYIHVVHVQVDQTPHCLQELCYRETKTDASTVALFVDSVQINVLYVFRRTLTHVALTTNPLGCLPLENMFAPPNVHNKITDLQLYIIRHS